MVAAAATMILVRAAADPPAAAPAAGATAPEPATPAAPAKVFCPVCGAENRAGSKFCRADGKPLPALEPGRQSPRFTRDPGTFSPEEVQEVMQRVAKSVVRIRVRA
ncbi:MAG TPA: zinc-ribbon domain-containing protein, partial [Dongiaceae bacterium]|nr:zinc-ribbon domain-containing protein [Dongiaceae bacterium]